MLTIAKMFGDGILNINKVLREEESLDTDGELFF